jgi:hypothetical protein
MVHEASRGHADGASATVGLDVPECRTVGQSTPQPYPFVPLPPLRRDRPVPAELEVRPASHPVSVPSFAPEAASQSQQRPRICAGQAASQVMQESASVSLGQRFGVRVPGGAPHHPSPGPRRRRAFLVACFAVGRAGAAANATEVCPARTLTSLGLAPAAIHRATAVCRRSWGTQRRQPGRPYRRQPHLWAMFRVAVSGRREQEASFFTVTVRHEA